MFNFKNHVELHHRSCNSRTCGRLEKRNFSCRKKRRGEGVGVFGFLELQKLGLGLKLEGLKACQYSGREFSNLKSVMEQNRLAILPYRQLCSQIKDQQYACTESGRLRFSHPVSSHKDMLWTLAISVYAARVAEKKLTFTFGYVQRRRFRG